MLTRCPRCLTVFQLLPEHVRMANGQVQCGRCNLQFNALEHLQNEILAPHPDATVRAGNSPQPGSALPVPAAASPAAPEMPERASDSSSSVEPEPAPQIGSHEQAMAAAGSAVSTEGGEEHEAAHAIKELENEIESLQLRNGARPLRPLSAEDLLLEDLPRVAVDRDEVEALSHYLAEGAAQPRPAGSAAWGIAAALLLVALLGQLLWFERATVFTYLPQARVWWQQICAGRSCALAPQRDLNALQVLARDVRDHPRYKGALLVNATLMNDAQFAQPFPVLELTLYDHAGHPLGVRRFSPQEYLDDSISLATGMKPKQPVYIVVELAGIGDQAVSFEFKFL